MDPRIPPPLPPSENPNLRSPYPPQKITIIKSQSTPQEKQPAHQPQLSRLSPNLRPEPQKFSERSTTKSFSTPVTLGMPSLKPIPANPAMPLPVSSNYDKPVPKDPRFYAAHVTAIPYSRKVTSRPGVHIPTARTLSTNSPANHNHAAMATMTATATQQSPFLYSLQQPNMPPNSRKLRYAPKNLFGTERQRSARQPAHMVALGSGLRMAAHTGHRPSPSQSHKPQDRNLKHTPQPMHKPRTQMPQAIASPHPMCERGYAHSMPRHNALPQPDSKPGPGPEPPLVNLSPKSPPRTKPLKAPQPFDYTKSVSMDDPPRTKDRSNSSPSTTPKAAQFLLELSVPPRVPLPAEFTSQHGSLGSDAFPAHTPTSSQRKNDNRDSSGKSRERRSTDSKKNCGRWHPAEHAQFLEGLQKFGRDWKKIATKVTTRTLVQIRTHAQKYFLRLGKERRKANGTQGSDGKAGKGNLVTPAKSKGKLGKGASEDKKSDASKRSRSSTKSRVKKALLLDENLSHMVSPPQVNRESTHALRVEAKSASKNRDSKLSLMVDRVAPLSFNFDSIVSGGRSPGGFLSVHVPPLKVPRTPVSTFHSGDVRLTALHKAALSGNLDEVKRLLNGDEKSGAIDVNKQDHQGYTALMIAASLPEEGIGLDICKAILALPDASMHVRDREGLTALHWAAAQGNPEIVEELVLHKCDIDLYAKPGRRVQPIFREKQRRSGRIGIGWNNETPLHRAARLGRSECVATLLRLGANFRARNERGESAFDVAGMYNDRVQVATSARSSVRALFHKHSSYFRTLVLHHDDCLEHQPVANKSSMGKDPWEHPDRIRYVLKALKDVNIFDDQLDFSSDFPAAERRAVLRVHSKEYLNFVQDLASSIECPEPFTPKVQKQLRSDPEHLVKDGMLSDTSFSKGSLKAALRAAGAICHAVDEVIEGRRRNSFCAVRPPGHHAGVNGLLLTSMSCGFCIFNNVAIGALHALAKHPTEVGKVAIIDIDVHHGNGTEEIVQQFPHPNKLLFVSLHIFDKDGDFSFYPGSGEKDLLEDNVINVALKPLWRRNVRRSSRSSSSSSSRDCKCGRKEWVLQMRQRVIASLRAFNPDLILISAGFDACKDDVGNGKYQPNYTCGMDLNAEDYVAITQSVMQVADICCNGRVVSILEGGYGNHRRRSEPIDRSSLARVCAAHVCTLAGHTHDWKEPGRTRTAQPKMPAKSPVASRLRNKPARSQSQASDNENENTERKTTVPLLPEQDEEKETELYCTCQEVANSEEFMIECSSGIRCNGWVHPKCLGLSITEDDAADLDNFVCDWCQASAGPGMSVVSKGFGDRKTKLSKRKSTDDAGARSTPAKRKRIPSRKFLKSQRL